MREKRTTVFILGKEKNHGHLNKLKIKIKLRGLLEIKFLKE